jgi:mono/diheme cytochrome c family protein
MRKLLLLLLLAATPLAAQPNTQGLRSSLSGVYTNAQAERGHQLYLNRCSRCHALLYGGGGGGAPAFGGENFNGDFDGFTLFDLENRIHTSMPRDQPGSTSRREATDLTAFILSEMKAPPGPSELPADDKALELIRIDVSK